MREDTSTAHQKAVLTKALSNGERIPANYVYAEYSSDIDLKFINSSWPGYITRRHGKFLLFNKNFSNNVEAYANGTTISELGIYWRFADSDKP